VNTVPEALAKNSTLSFFPKIVIFESNNGNGENEDLTTERLAGSAKIFFDVYFANVISRDGCYRALCCLSGRVS
jgi:hypothetical protein